MKKTILVVTLLFITSLGVIQAQSVFKKYGFKKEVLTLSKGKYQEVFKNEEVVQIGTVLLNTKTNKVVKLLNEDTTKTTYNAELSSRFLTIDPLAEKYYSISPYAFCANNPIKFVDPDGRVIKFAPGSSTEFKNNFLKAQNYLYSHGAGSLLQSLHSSKEIIYIKEANNKASFSPNTSTINWDPTMGVITTNGTILSPSTVLNHEADHAVQEITLPTAKKIDKNTSDKDYTNKEEERVITGSEQETAKKLGEIKSDEVTRTDHSGTPFKTIDPTSTDGANQVNIIAPKKQEDKNK